jgi:uncharacterized protein YbjT (DUF2867 family)
MGQTKKEWAMGLVAVTGASGKTGWRVVDEALRQKQLTVLRLELGQTEALHAALSGCDALVIATGARPSVDLAGPLKVDAFGVRDQIHACQAVGLRRVVLVSSLCAGRWQHPLNLFGLILVWKRLGESWLEQSGLEWTVIRPGGLSEDDSRTDREGVVFSGADQQERDSIPRRLVARVCLEALGTPASVGRIIEITSSPEQPPQPLSQWLTALAPG